MNPEPRDLLDAVALDSQQRASLVCIRSWGRAGLRAGAFAALPATPAGASRWCATVGSLPSLDGSGDGTDLAQAVIRLVERHRPAVVVPTHDGTVEVIRQIRSEIERYSRVALPGEPALEVAVSKPLTLALARKLGVGVPRSCAVASVDALDAALAEVGLPAVLKPERSWIDDHHRRVVSVLVATRDEARAALAAYAELGVAVIAQQWVRGSREAINLFYADGRVVARFAQVAHRMTPPLGGSSVLRESIPPPTDLVDAAERLVRELDLDGYSEIEFRRDGDGRPQLMEINPRLSASIEIAVRAGVDFPLLIYRWACGMSLPTVNGYRYGLRMRWLGGDLQWLYWVRRQQGRPDVPRIGRAVGTFALDFLKPVAYDYVDVRDPRPALVATGSLVRRAGSGKAVV